MEGYDDSRAEPLAAYYSLEDLLERMEPMTFPEVADFGPSVGEEIW